MRYIGTHYVILFLYIENFHNKKIKMIKNNASKAVSSVWHIVYRKKHICQTNYYNGNLHRVKENIMDMVKY